MLCVRNLSVMELGALFNKTGIFCLMHYSANGCVFFCICVSLFYHEYCDCECYCLEAVSTVVDMQVMCCS